MTHMVDDGRSEPATRLGNYTLFLLLCLYMAVCWISFFFVVRHYGSKLQLDPLDGARSRETIIAAAPFAAASVLFAVRPFSFGYAVSFCLYTVLLGYASLLPL